MKILTPKEKAVKVLNAVKDGAITTGKVTTGLAIIGFAKIAGLLETAKMLGNDFYAKATKKIDE